MKTLRILSLIANIISSMFAYMMAVIMVIIFLISAIAEGEPSLLIPLVLTILCVVVLTVFHVLSVINFIKAMKGKKSLYDVFSMSVGFINIACYILLIVTFLHGVEYTEISDNGIISGYFWLIFSMVLGLLSVVISVISLIKGKKEVKDIPAEN